MTGAFHRLRSSARRVVAAVLSEGLGPGRAAAAVFTGVFIGIVPIYGFQSLAAVGAAVLFRLNKPLTLAATFINNPLLQPLLVATSIGLGHLMLNGHYQVITESPFTAHGFTNSLSAWFAGSAVLGVGVGGLTALGTFVAAGLGSEESRRRRARCRQVRGMYARCPWGDRGFVRWKLRLDRVFDFLEVEDPGTGTVIDLGCGHGIASAFVVSGSAGRKLLGCDLDGHRVAVAQQAFEGLDAVFQVEDVRRFPLAPARLILILDVLQYLDHCEQLDLLGRCAGALEGGGKLIFRIQDEERGLYSRFSMGLDRVVFALGRAGRRPSMLTGEEYQRVLEDAGLDVRQVRFRNRLPLAHRLVIAVKAGPGSRGQDRKTTLNRVQVVPWVGQALPPANRSGSDQELAGESACPTFFHGISRAVGPFKQGRKNRIEKPLAWPAFRPAGKLKHAPPKASVFHGISRAAGPSQQTGLPADFRQTAPEIHGSLVSPRGSRP
jgi:2-polyprenyl-6-hydroxyphenyl methylase/3-demethylubiquinone-9 3-methyltransferase